MSNRAEIISNAVMKHGHRLTAARQTIIEALVQSEGHITADALAARVHATVPQIGRMTVYRTLELLSRLGVVRPIYQGTGAAHYVLMTGGSHHHLICNRCHGVIEFDDCTAGELARQLADRFNFQVSSHLLELNGICANCHN